MARESAPKGRKPPKKDGPVEKRDEPDGDQRAARLAPFVIAGIATLALLWIGAESHYHSCVAAAEAENTVQVLQNADGSSIVGQQARVDAVDDCSRLPF